MPPTPTFLPNLTRAMTSPPPYRIRTITDYHRLTGLPAPAHPSAQRGPPGSPDAARGRRAGQPGVRFLLHLADIASR
ncbi:MAG: hypothetical protein WKG07_20495 [Hymenobacter sp.]